MNFLKYLFGYVASIIFFIIGIIDLFIFMIINFFNEGFIQTHSIAFFFFVIAPIATSVVSFLFSRKKHSKENSEIFEVALIKFAQRNNGVISIPQTAAHFNKPVQFIDSVLKQMQGRDVFEVGVSDRGTVIYKLLE